VLCGRLGGVSLATETRAGPGRHDHATITRICRRLQRQLARVIWISVSEDEHAEEESHDRLSGRMPAAKQLQRPRR